MMNGLLYDSDQIRGCRVTANKKIPEKRSFVCLFLSILNTISSTSKQPFQVLYSQILPVKMGCRFKTKFHTSCKLNKLIEIICPTKLKEVDWKGNYCKTRGTSARNNLNSKPTPLHLVPNLMRNSQKLCIQFLHQSKALCLCFQMVYYVVCIPKIDVMTPLAKKREELSETEVVVSFHDCEQPCMNNLMVRRI